MKLIQLIIVACLAFNFVVSSAMAQQQPEYGPPPCKDEVIETEDGKVCTTENGIRFQKRGDAWFRMEKLHEKPLGGKNSVPNVVGRAFSKAFGW